MANICNLKTTVHCYSEQHAMEVKMGIENSFGSDNAEEKDMFFKQSESHGFWLFSADFEKDGNKVIVWSRIKWMLGPLEALLFIQYLTNIAGKVPIEIEYDETVYGFTFGRYLYDGTAMINWWLPSKAYRYLPVYPLHQMLYQALEGWGRKTVLFDNVDRALYRYPKLLAEAEQKKEFEGGIGNGEVPYGNDDDKFPQLNITITVSGECELVSSNREAEFFPQPCWDSVKWLKIVEEAKAATCAEKDPYGSVDKEDIPF
ncbi:hypothetical protein C5Q97_14830 [Victivallales bacterium CCUG 44730]|nr:hypothetical protein C5Q97_14830 [Victivallales bacterium CCUG 44730]